MNINYEKFGKLLEEYLKINPLDESPTYYDHDADIRQGQNEIKEELLKLWQEVGGNVLECSKHKEYKTINGECRICFWNKK